MRHARPPFWDPYDIVERTRSLNSLFQSLAWMMLGTNLVTGSFNLSRAHELSGWTGLIGCAVLMLAIWHGMERLSRGWNAASAAQAYKLALAMMLFWVLATFQDGAVRLAMNLINHTGANLLILVMLYRGKPPRERQKDETPSAARPPLWRRGVMGTWRQSCRATRKTPD